MGIETGQIEFKLSRPISYSFDGTTHETTLIVLQEPGMEHQKYYSRLEEMIMKSQLEIFEKHGIEPDEVGEVQKSTQEQLKEIESNIEAVSMQLYRGIVDSDTVNLAQFNSVFGKMVCIPRPKKSICLVDGRAIMTEAIWNNMDLKDAQNMALRWCSFFVMPSEEGQKKPSGQQSESVTAPTEA